MELKGLRHEQELDRHSPLLHRNSRSITRPSTSEHINGRTFQLEDNGPKLVKNDTELSGMGYEAYKENIDGFAPLERPLTVGGEPNPEAPHTPEPVSEPPEDRKELSPPGILSWEAIALLAPFGILGLLARLGITAIATYRNQAIFSLAWVQAVGCFVMGLAQYQKPFIMSL